MTTSILRFMGNRIIRRAMSSNCVDKGQAFISKSDMYLAANYSPLPVVLSGGKGIYVTDVNGKQYMDFLAGNGTVTLGHNNSKLNKAVFAQLKKIAMVPRECYSKSLAGYAEYISQLLCYDKVLPTCTAFEAAEAAVKIARKWGYFVKGVQPNEAKIIFPQYSFWGTSIAGLSAASHLKFARDFGPPLPGFETVPFNNIESLCEKLQEKNVCAFMTEPILTDAGVIVPDMSYLKKAKDACSETNCLFIADESSCGIGRAGGLLTCDIYQTRPDVLVLGCGLSNGLLPVSMVVSDREIMDVLEHNNHLSVYGGYPVACRVAAMVLKTVYECKISECAKDLGVVFREELSDLPREVITEVRGIGLLNAIVVHEDIDAFDLSLELLKNGLLAHPPKQQVVLLTPPLTIKEKEILKASQIIRKSVNSLLPQNDKSQKCQRLTQKGRKKKKRPRKLTSC